MKNRFLGLFFVVGFLPLISNSQTTTEEKLREVEELANSLRTEIFNQTGELDGLIDNLNLQVSQLSGVLPVINSQLSEMPVNLANKLNQFCNFIDQGSVVGAGCGLQAPPTRPDAKKIIVVNHGVNIFLDRLGENANSLSNIPFLPSANFPGYFVFVNSDYTIRGFERPRPTHIVPNNLNCRFIEIRSRVGAYMGDGRNDNSFLSYTLRHNLPGDTAPRFLGAPPDTWTAQVFWNHGGGGAYRIFPPLPEFTPGPATINFYRRHHDDTGGFNLYSQNREFFVEPTPNQGVTGYYFDVNFKAATPTGGQRTDLCYQ